MHLTNCKMVHLCTIDLLTTEYPFKLGLGKGREQGKHAHMHAEQWKGVARQSLEVSYLIAPKGRTLKIKKVSIKQGDISSIKIRQSDEGGKMKLRSKCCGNTQECIIFEMMHYGSKKADMLFPDTIHTGNTDNTLMWLNTHCWELYWARVMSLPGQHTNWESHLPVALLCGGAGFGANSSVLRDWR